MKPLYLMEIDDRQIIALKYVKLKHIEPITQRMLHDIETAETPRSKKIARDRHAKWVAACKIIVPLLRRHRSWAWGNALAHLKQDRQVRR